MTTPADRGKLVMGQRNGTQAEDADHAHRPAWGFTAKHNASTANIPQRIKKARGSQVAKAGRRRSNASGRDTFEAQVESALASDADDEDEASDPFRVAIAKLKKSQYMNSGFANRPQGHTHGGGGPDIVHVSTAATPPARPPADSTATAPLPRRRRQAAPLARRRHCCARQHASAAAAAPPACRCHCHCSCR